ncbi:DUF1441 family protein [Leclercia adecarboxylata]|uniref:DUF1441 family protein n=1 Tax=Leclercia adecarboxylata TaxID=83655 RepID=UPI002DB657DB|nr:DUF1441 family protein [Leclercia adecarboxylata]MEB5748669.1 DUF1441 family protein [Leclercia adecarboxylata]
MDNELKNFRLNINQLATLTELHRQTVASRLSNVPLAPGSNPKLKLYSVLDILTALLTRSSDPAQTKVDEMIPTDRKAWFQSERERLKFQQEDNQLIAASDVTREFSAIAKAVVQVLETLPDILERDCGLQPTAVARVQAVIDDLRDQMAQRVFDADTDDEDDDLQEG